MDKEVVAKVKVRPQEGLVEIRLTGALTSNQLWKVDGVDWDLLTEKDWPDEYDDQVYDFLKQVEEEWAVKMLQDDIKDM